MKKIDETKVDAIRNHVKENAETTYAQVAISFGVSEVSVKRICSDLGRGKDWRRGQKTSPNHPENFWENVDRKSSGCWDWKGSRNNAGYGFCYHNGTSQAAHRVAYALEKGPIPEGLELDHRCRNRTCCNPEHLEPVTRTENMKRMHQSRDAGPDNRVAQPIEMPKPSVREVEELGGFVLRIQEGERNSRRAEDLRWRLTNEQLFGNKHGRGQIKLPIFCIRNIEDAICVMVAAQSEDFAKEMFESIWGLGYDVAVGEAGTLTMQADYEETHSWTWRAKLKREHSEWETTEKGKRCRARVSQERHEKARWERLDREAELAVEEQSELWSAQQQKAAEEKKAAKEKKAYCQKCPHCGGHVATKRDYDRDDHRESFSDEGYEE